MFVQFLNYQWGMHRVDWFALAFIVICMLALMVWQRSSNRGTR